MKKYKKLIQLTILIALIIYVIYILFSQEQTIRSYSKSVENLNVEIANEKQHNEDLNNQKDNINSLDYIEEAAREKLDMYYPNERIYVDTQK